MDNFDDIFMVLLHFLQLESLISIGTNCMEKSDFWGGKAAKIFYFWFNVIIKDVQYMFGTTGVLIFR